ncbi:hypothetical protein ANN_02007 [Periplaneta americana]|uniref:Uncharacterized protein n=1 Tax=Periplaneta americana TaxID=6978 RepID=A0ABQ8TV16_PERAM|nr:hypothetical protein ANN_02007 [Periplaneta americana]
MAGLCKGGNEPPGSLKASKGWGSRDDSQGEEVSLYYYENSGVSFRIADGHDGIPGWDRNVLLTALSV